MRRVQYLVIITLVFFVVALASCSKSSDKSKNYMSGTITYDLPLYTIAGQTVSLYSTGILSPQGVKYCWASSNIEFEEDTVWSQRITFQIPDTIGTISVTAYAKYAEYYTSSTTKSTTVINPDIIEGSFAGFSVSDELFTDPRDGEMYFIQTIGNLKWFALNLRYAGTDEHPIGCAYEYSDAIAEPFGLLYSWNEATGGKAGSGLGGGPQGACPDGWSVPTPEDWEDFGAVLNGGESVDFGDKWTGLAPFICAPVTILDEQMWPYCPDFEKTDKYKWNGIPCGLSTDGHEQFEKLLSYAFWWSSGENADGTKGRYKYIWCDRPDMPAYEANKDDVGCSVRCVKLVNGN